MDFETGKAFIRDRVTVTRQHVAVAKQILLKSTASTIPSQTLIDSVLSAHSLSIPKQFALHLDPDLPSKLAKTADAISWQLAAQEALWSLIHGGVYIPDGGAFWTAPTGMDVTTGNMGAGWNFDDLSLPVPVQVRRAPSLACDGEQFLTDPDLYLQRVGAENMHPEVREALSEAVRCFRSELYTAAVAMLGKASEGTWLLLGAALLRAAGPNHVAMFAKQRQALEDPMTGAKRKIDAVLKIFDRRDVFGAVEEACGIGSTELQSVAQWSDTVRDSRNTIHFGVTPATPNTYEKVAVLLLATPQPMRILHRLMGAAAATAPR